MPLDPLSRWLHDREAVHGPVILMYHSIQTTAHPRWRYSVALSRFRAQLDFLRDAGYRTVTVSELVQNPAGCSGRVVAITFDDGYVDNLDACALLAERDMRATWYVATAWIGQVPPWSEPGQPRDRLLSEAELRQISQSGMEIGSHTETHPSLPDLDDEAVTRELRASKTTLETILQRPVFAFAYPYGRWEPRMHPLLASAGYTSACTTRSGWAFRDANAFQLRRLTVFNSDSNSHFARKLAFAANDASWAIVFRYATARFSYSRRNAHDN